MCRSDPESGGSCSSLPSSGGDTEVGRIFSALADDRSRHICYHAFENDPTDVAACVEAVASMERGEPPASIPTEILEQIELSLYHRHLPRLTELGIIEYDARSGAIRCQHPSNPFKQVLAVAREMETE